VETNGYLHFPSLSLAYLSFGFAPNHLISRNLLDEFYGLRIAFQDSEGLETDPRVGATPCKKYIKLAPLFTIFQQCLVKLIHSICNDRYIKEGCNPRLTSYRQLVSKTRIAHETINCLC